MAGIRGEVLSPQEVQAALPWHQKVQAPDTARVLYVPHLGREPLVVADPPLSALLDLRVARASGNLVLTVAENKPRYSALGEFLWNHKRVEVPEDSPVRSLPRIKFYIPPAPGMERVGWAVSFKESQELLKDNNLGQESGNYYIYAEVTGEKAREIRDWAETFFDPEDITKGFDETTVGVLRRLVKPSPIIREPLDLTTGMLYHFKIPPDPDSPAYERFLALHGKTPR